jgi:tetrahydromethanopterin S-methyltransferase subunit F
MREKIGSVVITLLLVSSVITAGFSGTASADTFVSEANCSDVDKIVFMVTYGFVNADKCINNDQEALNNLKQNISENDAQQAKVDIYTKLVEVDSQYEKTETVILNYINDSENVAWSKAEVAIARAEKNGSTKQTAKQEARNAIENYYAKKQINYLESRENIHYAIHSARQTAENESNISNEFVAPTAGLSTDQTYKFLNLTFQLVNGSTHTIRVTGHEYNGNFFPGMEISEKFVVDSENNNFLSPTTKTTVEAPDSNYNVHRLVTKRNDRVYNSIANASNRSIDRTDTFVDSIWQDVQDGVISSDEIISRNTRIFEYGVQSQGNNSSYSNIIGATAGLGVETPNLNNTGTITVEVNGVKYEGMLFGNPPNGTWVKGETYNATNIAGPVQIATTSGNIRTINENFTIVDIVNKDGTSKNSVDTKQYNYQTSNTEDLLNKTQDLQTLREEAEEREVQAAGGGGSLDGSGDSSGNFNFSLPSWLEGTAYGLPVWLIAVALLVVAYYVYEQYNY